MGTSRIQSKPVGIGTKVARGFGSNVQPDVEQRRFTWWASARMTESQAKDKALREAMNDPLFNDAIVAAAGCAKRFAGTTSSTSVCSARQAGSGDWGDAVQRTHESSDRQGSCR